MAKKKSTKKVSTTQKVGIGIGLTAAAVAAAGTYFLYGSPNAAKNRKKVKSWMLKAKAEVLEALENAQDMTEDEYRALVGAVAKAYSKVRETSKGDIEDFKREMMGHWKKIEKAAPMRNISRAAKKSTKKTTKKNTAKKTSKKASKKAAKRSKKR
jgi:hypothetical protein